MDVKLSDIKRHLTEAGKKCDSAHLNDCVALNPRSMPVLENAIINGKLRSDMELLLGAMHNPYVKTLVENGYFRNIPAVNNNGDLFDPSGQRHRSLSDVFRETQQGLQEVYDKLNAPEPTPEPTPEPAPET